MTHDQIDHLTRTIEQFVAGLEGDPHAGTTIRASNAATLAVADHSSNGLGPAALPISELPRLSISGADTTSDLIPRRELGVGGMGKVDLVVQRSLRREVRRC